MGNKNWPNCVSYTKRKWGPIHQNDKNKMYMFGGPIDVITDVIKDKRPRGRSQRRCKDSILKLQLTGRFGLW